MGPEPKTAPNVICPDRPIASEYHFFLLSWSLYFQCCLPLPRFVWVFGDKHSIVYLNQLYLFSMKFYFFCFLAVPHGMRNLSSPTRNWSHVPCSGSAKDLTTGPREVLLELLVLFLLCDISVAFSDLSSHVSVKVLRH